MSTEAQKQIVEHVLTKINIVKKVKKDPVVDQIQFLQLQLKEAQLQLKEANERYNALLQNHMLLLSKFRGLLNRRIQESQRQNKNLNRRKSRR